ncbi:MAG TPA: ATP-binding protein [Bryobacteraceae bacterium]|nr:ATP-binding protein [Bryobacteraceae bacterium]
MANKHVTNTDLLELLFNQIREFIVVLCNTEGTLISWCPAVLTELGYGAGEFVGQNLKLLYPAAERKSGEEELDAAREIGRASATRRLVKKSGEELWVDSLTIALRDAHGTLVGFGKIFRGVAADPLATAHSGLTHSDVSARLRMQQELEMANDRLKRMANELERSNEELEEFARIASHDLSAPITSTLWLVELLSTKYGRQLDEDGRKCLRQISMSLERMADLVEAILAHAQVGVNAINSPENTDADEALAISLDNLRHDIETSGAVILHEPLPPLPVQAQPLTQLFQNLLSNAIKYRQPGVEPMVRVAAERQGADWLISVRDNGIGIEPDWAERIFLPLQRRHGMQVAGSGIGLATCKKIVMRAGGRIWVESEVGAGSIFYITFPAAQRAAASGA